MQLKLPLFDSEHVETEFQCKIVFSPQTTTWEEPLKYEAYFRRRNGTTLIVLNTYRILKYDFRYHILIGSNINETGAFKQGDLFTGSTKVHKLFLPSLDILPRKRMIEFVRGFVRMFFSSRAYKDSDLL